MGAAGQDLKSGLQSSVGSERASTRPPSDSFLRPPRTPLPITVRYFQVDRERTLRIATMDSRSANVGEPDWSEAIFNTTQFDDSMTGDSPFSNTAFDQFTNLETYADSPGISMRTPVKSGRDATTMNGAHLAQHSVHLPGSASASASAESSPQDSASDSSGRRKRKVTSESPMSDAMTAQPVVKEDSFMDMGDNKNTQHFDQGFTRPMHDLSLLEQDAGINARFDFGSAESSPDQQRGYGAASSLNRHAHMPATSMASQYQQSPVCIHIP